MFDPVAFVAMPFSPKREMVYRDAIKTVLKNLGFKVARADEFETSGLIIQEIVSAIADSDIVIADMTELNPNVFYEIAVAHTLGKPTVLLAERGTVLPFDVRFYRVELYNSQALQKLLPRLENVIQACMNSRPMNPVIDALNIGIGVPNRVAIDSIYWELPFGACGIFPAVDYGNALMELIPIREACKVRDIVVAILEQVLPESDFHPVWRDSPFVGVKDSELATRPLSWIPKEGVFSGELEGLVVEFNCEWGESSLAINIDPDEDHQYEIPPVTLERVRNEWYRGFKDARPNVDELVNTVFARRTTEIVLDPEPRLVVATPRHTEMEFRWDVSIRGQSNN